MDLERAEEYLRFAVSSISKKAYVFWGCMFACVVMITVLIVLRMGFSHQLMFPWDTTIFLDAAWRLCCGQRAHIDFSYPYGDFFLDLIRVGMAIVGPKVQAITVGMCIFAATSAAAIWSIGSRRMPALLCFLVSSMVFVLPIATYPLGFHYKGTSYAMLYDRVGWALLCIIAVEEIFPRRLVHCDWLDRLNFMLGSLCIGMEFYVKMNFFLVACGIVCYANIIRGNRWWALLAKLIGVIGVIFVLGVSLRISIVGYLSDLSRMEPLYQPVDRIEGLLRVLDSNGVPLMLLFIAWAAVVRDWTPRSQRVLLTVMVVVAASIMVTSTNGQLVQIPLIGLAAGYLLGPAGMGQDSRGAERGGELWIGWVVAVFLIGTVLVPDVASVINSVSWKESNAVLIEKCRFHEKSIEELILPPAEIVIRGNVEENGCSAVDDVFEGYQRYRETALTENEGVSALLSRNPWVKQMTAFEYCCWIKDGLKLLKPRITEKSTIMVMDYSNPFPFALGLPSARWDMPMWNYTGNVTGRTAPSVQKLVATVDIIMIPKRAVIPYTSAFMQRHYAAMLAKDYTKVAESKLWVLLQRRGL
ncbi:MAG: hypothetical protein WBS54_05470 [Acidobacteriota bacterium]